MKHLLIFEAKNPFSAFVALTLAAFCWGAVAGHAYGQEVVPHEQTPIVLQASEAVPAKLLKSEYHQVADRVVNDG